MIETPKDLRDKGLVLENYARGVIVTDISGKRGRHGAAYAGSDHVWRNQPVGMEPFETVDSAVEWARTQTERGPTN